MKLVIIESPFQNNPLFVEYARRALADSLKRGEAPYASHLLYPQCLDDAKPEERKQGMAAGWAWMAKADLVAVYSNYGLTTGMGQGVAHAEKLGIPVVYRVLPDEHL